MTRRKSHPVSSGLFATIILLGVGTLAGVQTHREAVQELQTTLTRFIISQEALHNPSPLSQPTLLALAAVPTLAAAQESILEYWDAPIQEPLTEEQELPDVVTPSEPLSFTENGVAAKTIVPSGKDYLQIGSVYLSSSTAYSLDTTALATPYTAPSRSVTEPTILIMHTHGSEAYTMPVGEEYLATSYCRTTDPRYNVVRIGDEIAAILTEQGFSVLHDRSLYDYPSYEGAYDRSCASAERYLEQYPSIQYILDIHRDAIEDKNGTPYKLLCQEDRHAAQLSLILGSAGSGLPHPHWQENLHLAVALQSSLLADYPTLMRPIMLRNSRYNQHLTTGSLLLEVGTAGNSLDEALCAAQKFALGFAEVLSQ